MNLWLLGPAWALTLCSLPSSVYLALLSLCSRRPRHVRRQQTHHFAVLVPAHNEAAQIATTVEQLRGMAYPPQQFTVWVVADNCDDATAKLASAAGAQVLERQDTNLRGKGYALEFAFAQLLQLLAVPPLDAVVVVDADTRVDSDLLQVFSGCLSAGAAVVQGHYGVSNPLASWRTRLMTLALAMFHRVRSLGRERLGLSAGLRGNGMCFSLATLRAQPHQAFGLAEDVEYGITLGLAGIRIAYADAARVYGEMVSSGQASQSQRRRWEGGRRQLLQQRGAALWRAMWQQRSLMLADLGMDLLVPPLSSVVLCIGLASALLGLQLAQQGSRSAPLLTTLCALNMANLGLYVGRGLVLSELGLHAVWALLGAPWYVLWKLVLRWRSRSANNTWVRTQRENEHPE